MPSTREIIVELLANLRFHEGQAWGRFVDDESDKAVWKPIAYPILPLRPDGSVPSAPLTTAETALLITEYLYRTFYAFGRTTVIPPEPARDFTKDTVAQFKKTTLHAVAVGQNRSGWIRVRHRTSHILAPAGLYVVEGGKNVILSILPFGSADEADADSQNQFTWVWVESTLPRAGSTVRYVRFYLHFKLSLGTGALMAETLKETLDDRGIPFRFKYLMVKQGDKLSEVRKDTAVLYVAADDFVPVVFALQEIYPLLNLTEGATLFVRPFEAMPGLSFAEDPIGGESFGKSRMKLLAAAALEAPDGIKSDGTVAAEPILKWISAQGYDLDAFHLGPTPTYPYEDALFRSEPRSAPEVNEPEALRKARQVGDWLCREALWLPGKRCNWVGARSNEKPILYSFLDETWQTGRLGVALFLRILTRYTGYPLYGYVADGAVPDLIEAIENEGDSLVREALKRLLEHDPSVSDELVVVPIAFTSQPVPLKVPSSQGFQAQEAFRKILTALQKEGDPLVLDEPYFSQIRRDPYVAVAFEANEWGIDDFVPGLNGLALVGFGFLRMADYSLPPIPTQALVPG